MSTATFPAPQPLLSRGTRLAAALGVALAVVAGAVGAAKESRVAVDASAAQISPHVRYVTLPRVQVVAKREAPAVAAAASAPIQP